MMPKPVRKLASALRMTFSKQPWSCLQTSDFSRRTLGSRYLILRRMDYCFFAFIIRSLYIAVGFESVSAWSAFIPEVALDLKSILFLWPATNLAMS